MKDQTKYLGALLAVSQTVSQTLDLNQLLKESLAKVIEVLNVDAGLIRLYHEDTQELVLTIDQGYFQEEIQHLVIRRKLGNGSSSQVAQSGKLRTTSGEQKGRGSFSMRAGFQASANIPLTSKGRLMGSMSVHQRTYRTFDSDEIEILENVGKQLGVAIENAKLFFQVSHRTEILTAINNISQIVNQSLDIDQILKGALDKIVDLLKYDAGLIRLLDEDTQELVITAHKGFSDLDIEKAILRRKFGDGLCWRCAQARKPVVTQDDDNHTSGFGNKLAFNSSANIPLLAKGDLVGTMSVFQRTPREFHPEEMELLDNIGNLMGVAIANAKLYQDRENTIATLQETQEKLENSNRNLQDFAYIVSHDLQEPLRKVLAFGDRLKAKCGAEIDPVGLDYLGRMQDASKRMKTLINDLLIYARVSIKEQPFETVDVGNLIRGVLADLEVPIEELQARVDVGDFPPLDVDPMQFRQLIQNLIGNSLKYHREGIAPEVKIYCSNPGVENRLPQNGASSKRYCDIIVEDNGIGFNQQYADRIFGVFQRLHGREAYEGTGIGLAICRKIAERHGGSITATSEAGKGAKFIISLPVKRPG